MCWFTDALGFADIGADIDQASGDQRARLINLLAEKAKAMILSGVQVSPEKWLSLSDVGKSAFILAGERIENERAVRLGLVIRSKAFLDAFESELVEVPKNEYLLKKFSPFDERVIIDLFGKD